MITFKKVKEEDIPLIQEIAYKTWPSTYDDLVGKEQVKFMLNKMYNTGELLAQLRSGSKFLLAESDNVAAGFASYSEEKGESGVYKLHKLYVLPELHGKGVGKVLINEVITQVKRTNGIALRLNVNKKNKAKDFYERCGFKIKESVNISIGNGFFMDDFIMEIAI